MQVSANADGSKLLVTLSESDSGGCDGTFVVGLCGLREFKDAVTGARKPDQGELEAAAVESTPKPLPTVSAGSSTRACRTSAVSSASIVRH